jgi:hypothetical protein
MAFEVHKNRSRAALEPSAKALTALAGLVRLLARQAAREVIAPSAELDRAAADNAGSEVAPHAVGLSAEK